MACCSLSLSLSLDVLLQDFIRDRPPCILHCPALPGMLIDPGVVAFGFTAETCSEEVAKVSPASSQKEGRTEEKAVMAISSSLSFARLIRLQSLSSTALRSGGGH